MADTVTSVRAALGHMADAIESFKRVVDNDSTAPMVMGESELDAARIIAGMIRDDVRRRDPIGVDFILTNLLTYIDDLAWSYVMDNRAYARARRARQTELTARLTSNVWVERTRVSAESAAVAAPLTADDSRMPISPMIKLPLYPYQIACVTAGCDLERVGQVDVNNVDAVSVRTNAATLSLALGAGKTLVMAAIIAGSTTVNRGAYGASGEAGFVRYTKRVLRTTVYVANPSPYDQCLTEFQTHTTMRVLPLHDALSIKRLLNTYATPTGLSDEGLAFLESHHVILVNCTMMVGSVCAPWDPAAQATPPPAHRHILSVFAGLIQMPVARLVLDDFDTAKLPVGTGIATMFTWYVSATNVAGCFGTDNETAPETMAALVDAKTVPRRKAGNSTTNDALLRSACNIAPSSAFLNDKSSFKMPQIVFGIVRYNNPMPSVMRAFHDMAAGDATLQQLLEMLNGDAHAAAGNRLGIVAETPAAVFQHVLKNSYGPYMEAMTVIKLVNTIVAKIAPMPMSAQPYEEHVLVHIRNLVAAGDPVVLPMITRRKERLVTVLKQARSEAIVRRTNNAGPLERLRAAQTECPVCHTALLNPDATDAAADAATGSVVFGCCAVIMCIKCALLGCGFRKAGNGGAVGSCPACKAQATPQSMIVLSGEMISMVATDEAPADAVAAGPATPAAPPKPKPKYPKFAAVLDVLDGRQPAGTERIQVTLPFMINGDGGVDRDRDPAATKVLIFTQHTEGLEKLSEFLTEHGRRFVVLRGNHTAKAACVTEFRENPAVRAMLVCTDTSCHGLNLQFATDEIFMHKIIKPEIEAQALGRAQRLGRDPNTPLRVLYVLYDDESFSTQTIGQ